MKKGSPAGSWLLKAGTLHRTAFFICKIRKQFRAAGKHYIFFLNCPFILPQRTADAATVM